MFDLKKEFGNYVIYEKTDALPHDTIMACSDVLVLRFENGFGIAVHKLYGKVVGTPMYAWSIQYSLRPLNPTGSELKRIRSKEIAELIKCDYYNYPYHNYPYLFSEKDLRKRVMKSVKKIREYLMTCDPNIDM